MARERPITPRLPATERRAGILAAATRCFAARGFAGTTTARVAEEAGVNEALVFRHYTSKQALYLACVDAAWARVQARCDELYATESDDRHWRMPGRAFLELVHGDPDVARMWSRGLVESTGIPEIDDHHAALMREVHAYVSRVVAHSAAAGGLLPGRDPATEAWTIIALGLLGASLGTRGLVERPAFDAVLASHREWTTGSPD
ncbi:MAG: TetR/AcrR family transcriptional regulator [Thermoleophilia bacterium]|nr:TetR/AcrR family transcriptional regulator [Thermoleophilia bacterium]